MKQPDLETLALFLFFAALLLALMLFEWQRIV